MEITKSLYGLSPDHIAYKFISQHKGCPQNEPRCTDRVHESPAQRLVRETEDSGYAKY